MAHTRTSMRMGALNLLVLVIALSLSVLGVLSLVTANADDALAQRHADATTQAYANDVSGQEFMMLLDARLVSSRNAGEVTDGLVSTLRIAVQQMAESAVEKSAEVYPDVAIEAVSDVLDTAELASQMKVPSLYSSADAETLALLSDYQIELMKALDNCVVGVSAEFTTETGHNLYCLIGINSNATYTVLKWESTKLWYGDQKEEVLWMG